MAESGGLNSAWNQSALFGWEDGPVSKVEVLIITKAGGDSVVVLAGFKS